MKPVRSATRVVIATDDPGWHGRVLAQGLTARGLAVEMLSLTACRLEVGPGGPTVALPGFARELPAGVFVRGVPGGTLEEVILRLDALHALSMLDVPVFNTGRAIERTVDKALTSFLLALHDIPTPRTWVLEQREAARAIVADALAHTARLVLKPLFGSQGEGLVLLDSLASFDAVTPVNGVYYLQEFVERGGPPYRDWRVLVIDGVARHAMSRTSAHWVTNRAQGAHCEIAPLASGPLRELAERAAAVLDIDYAGVDLMCDGTGQWVVGEVNGVPAWWGLQQACGDAVTADLIDAFVAKMRRAPGAGGA